MEAVIFIGIQGAGKSTFFKERFFDTHVRINRDMLRTPHREELLVAACIEAKQPFVIDKTNVTRAARRGYIAQAKAAGFRVVGYFLESKLADCLTRNSQRPDNQFIPIPGVLAMHRKLVRPTRDEGFDELYHVRIGPEGSFIVEEWIDEV